MLVLIFAITAWAPAQEITFDYSGYLKELGALGVDSEFEHTQYDNIIHHRIETELGLGKFFTLNADARNRLLTGYSIRHNPGSIRSQYDRDPGYADLTHVWFDTDDSIFQTNIDRLSLQYSNGPFDATIGRQRINWGRTFVWSPNDLFNNFAYLDFDYEERPGTDAVHASYSWSYASSLEGAWQFGDSWDKSVVAGMFRGSLGTYDVQGVLGHYYDQLAVGAGWSGYISGAGLKGEITYFHPEDNFTDESGNISATAGMDYMFNNSIFLRGELLYNGGFQRSRNPAQQLLEPPRANNLFVAETAAFLDASYPFHPLINGSLGTMLSFDRSIYVIIPQVLFSVTDNIDFLLLSQLLYGDVLQDATPTPNLFYFRLKWSY